MEFSKTTKVPGRRYDEACAATHALDLLGERWALLVVRELMFGPKRFSGLRASLPAISANVLTQRLDGLEAAGVVERQSLPPPASIQVYALTPWGLEVEPIFQALGRWGARSPQHDPRLPFSAASLMLSLRTMIDRGAAVDAAGAIGFRIGSETYVASLAAGSIEIARGDSAGCAVVFAGTAESLAAAIYGGALEALEAKGALVIEGDRALARRFVTLFPLPPKVAARREAA